MENKLKKEIYILSASDRYNYGDLLFPIITKKALSDKGDYDFRIIGCVKSDLSRFGALPTEQYNELYNVDDERGNRILLIAGGEVLGANWSRLLSFIYPWYYFVFSRTKKIRSRLEKITVSFLGHGDNPYPFIPSSYIILKNYKIVFNAVGGSGISKHSRNLRIHEVFESSIFFSSREKQTYSEIRDYFNVQDLVLSPDSAILMSDYYSYENAPPEKYITFQVGHHKNGNSLELINNQLNKLSQNTDMPIYFLPIGNCPGHDDSESLKWLLKNSKYRSKYIEPTSIEIIMKTIAQSELFIGTSLHGIITAMSFETPFLGMNPKISKLKFYLETWIEAPYNKIANFNELEIEGIKRLRSDENNKVLKISLGKQKELANKYFNEISNRIDES